MLVWGVGQDIVPAGLLVRRRCGFVDARGVGVLVLKVRFVESKTPNFRRIEALLGVSARENQWANRGPLYTLLRDRYLSHFGLTRDAGLVPVSNGGVALEAMARLLDQEAGRRLRWVGSPFSFKNLGRGYFADMAFVDCDARGLLDLARLAEVDPGLYDGIVLTNPFGLFVDFSAYTAFAERTGKKLIIDNAAGVHAQIPDHPWQAFSLHHTKPYGAGEGGLARVPAAYAEALYDLLNYGDEHYDSPYWFTNGKLSDISCAFLIDRLEDVRDWSPLYLEQRERVTEIAARAGLVPLAEPETDAPMTSMPFLAPVPVALETLERARRIVFAKYYQPLRDLPVVSRLFGRLLNIPCHPDMAHLTDARIEADLEACLVYREAV